MNKFEQVSRYIQLKGKVNSDLVERWCLENYLENRIKGSTAMRYLRELRKMGKVRHSLKNGEIDKYSFEWIRQDKSGQMSML